MNKVFKKITACTLVGAIVAGSFGSYNQVNAKEADTGRKTKILRDISSETSYIVDCKNRFVYDKISKEYLQETEKEEYLQGNNLVSVELTETELKEIQKTGAVIEEDICVTGSGNKATKQTKADKDKKVNKNTKKDKKRELPWNVESLGVTEETQTSEDSSESNGTQEKVKVAILDSGIDFSENINVVERKNFMDDEVSPLYEDNTGHGTAIAGIIASSGEDGMVKGVNPNVEIYSARILDTDNKAPISRVVESIYWAIEEDVDIINISFGTTANSEILHNAIKDATDAGILVFAASGNQGEDEGSTVEYPAAYEEVVAVGATNPDGKVADMTSTGEELDIVAPGINIHSVGWLDMEVTCSGTSMAVPHAVGAASLLWEMDKDKSADFIKGLLEASAKNVEEDGEEYSFIDVEYAKEIYDEYCEKYRAAEDVEEINEIYENDREVETYDEAVTGSWSKAKHEKTVEYASECAGDLSTSELKIVKIGVRAPDVWYSANIYDGTNKNPWYLNLRMFHAMEDFNYVKVYEYIMGMSMKCREEGIVAAQNINYPNNNAGEYGECEIVKCQLNKACIENILYGIETDEIYGYTYSKKRASLIMLGFAMHLLGDVFSHKSWEQYSQNRWVSHGDYPQKGAAGSGKYETKKANGNYNRADDVTCCPKRFVGAKEACANALLMWSNNISADSYDIITDVPTGYFCLEKLYTYTLMSPHTFSFSEYGNKLKKLSYAD